MRVKIGDREIEVVNFKSVDKGSLKGFFNLMEYPEGRKTLDCKYFEKDDQTWFAFPTKKITRDGEPDDYIPYISYTDKVYLEELKSAVLKSIRGSNGEANTYKKQASNVQDDSSSLWG